MNQDDLINIINNFRESEWTYDNVNKIGIYNDDFNLQLKKQNRTSRNNDEILTDEVWDDLFAKYPNSELINAVFVYRDAILSDHTRTYLLFNNIIVPLPVGANMINNFYENELSIAKMLSEDKNSFDKILSGCKKHKKYY